MPMCGAIPPPAFVTDIFSVWRRSHKIVFREFLIDSANRASSAGSADLRKKCRRR